MDEHRDQPSITPSLPSGNPADRLLIVDGLVRVQRWGEPALDVRAGDAVVFSPGEKHWHGAAPGVGGTHLAVNVNVKTDWLEPVTDQEYGS